MSERADTRATINFLRHMRKLIEKGWTQDATARNANGIDVPSTDEEATCWCIIGAINRTCADKRYSLLGPTQNNARTILRSTINPGQASDTVQLVYWNDYEGRTQEEVLRVIDQSIQRVQLATK